MNHGDIDNGPCEAPPVQGPKTAVARLAACAFAALLLAELGCRPRWSADGKRLTYAAVDGKRHLVAQRDLDAGTSGELFDIGLADGAMDMVRDPDLARWVIVWADGTDDGVVNVKTRDDQGKEGKSHAIRVGGRNLSTMLVEPVVADGHVFLTGSTVIRVDLDTGETQQQGRRGLATFPADDGVGYITMNARDWEIGTMDPETMELTPWITKPDDCEWRLAETPRFDPTGKRCAVVAVKGRQRAGLDALKWAVLVLEDGELLTTIEIKGKRSMGPIAWIDDVTICGTVMRPGKTENEFALFETNFSGSFQRETTILKAPIHQRLAEEGGVVYQLKQPLFLQPSPSPDGKTVAFTTAKMPELPEDLAGLLLLHRDRKNEVERIPFRFEDK